MESPAGGFLQDSPCAYFNCGGGCFSDVSVENKIFTDSVIVNSTPVTVVQGARVEKLGGNILLYSKDGMSCLDSKGGALWNQTFEMQNPHGFCKRSCSGSGRL